MANKLNSTKDLIPAVLGRYGIKRGVSRARAVLLWPKVAGRDLAAFAQARRFREGTLFVEVTDSETAQHLRMQAARLIRVYHESYGLQELHSIHFSSGRVYPEAPSVVRPEILPDPEGLARWARELEALQLPDALTSTTFATAKALLTYQARCQAQGWRPCSICAVHIPEGSYCLACERHRHSPKVQRAANMLATKPHQLTPQLSDDERAVALYLAEHYLREQLQALLPQTLADGRLRRQLEQIARCYLAYVCQKPLQDINDDDMALHLDARVARVLGLWAR